MPVAIGAIISVIIVAICALGMWGCPRYNVYEQSLSVGAELARATQNRQIKTQEALAMKESAKMLGEAEVERSRVVSAANKIIGESLHNNEAYLRYLWINGLKDNGHAPQVIYVPTEAGLPILEAGRTNGK